MKNIYFSEAINLPSRHGALRLQYFSVNGREGVLVFGIKCHPEILPVRLHSSCLFSEALGTNDCDCADQLNAALEIVAKEGGVVIYLYDEGRGVGLRMKFAAIKLQHEKGYDTKNAYEKINRPPDPRTFEIQAAVLTEILKDKNKIELITNNPRKMKALQDAGLNVIRMRPCVSPRPEMRDYLQKKVDCLGHVIND